jgi:ABC-type dipeptide/oligopeptide/nickel transport system permease subunit
MSAVMNLPAANEDVQQDDGFLRRLLRNPLCVIGLSLIGTVIAAAVLAPWITQYGPLDIDGSSVRQLPSAAHWFGTDHLGRDIFARVLYGAGVSLRVGIFALLMSLLFGVAIGAIAGLLGGRVDAVLMRLTDLSLAIPNLVAATALITVIGRGETAVWLVLGMLGWMSVARILRASVMSVRASDFVDAARLAGCPMSRLILLHVLPNSIQPVIVFSFNLVGLAILAEASLSFLGLGIEPPAPSWGLMVAESRSFLASSPHMILFPSAALAITIAGFSFLGDGLRDVLDARLR